MKVAEEKTNNLSQCKLCGGEAKMAKIERSDGQVHYDNWSITCTRCGCHFEYAADGYYGRDFMSKKEAIQKWNSLHKTDRKIYVVTSGCYSDYSIDAVFTDPVTANSYANLNSDRRVEEYEADSVQLAEAGIKARICYDPKANKITSIDTDEYMQSHYMPSRDEYYYDRFRIERKLSARTLKDVKMHGKKSQLLLKVMQDAWAQYKAEHMLELEEDDKEVWISVGPEEAAKAFGILANNYNIAFISTSMATECDPATADTVCTEIINDFWKNGVKFPTGDDLKRLQEQLIKRTVEENTKTDEHD